MLHSDESFPDGVPDLELNRTLAQAGPEGTVCNPLPGSLAAGQRSVRLHEQDVDCLRHDLVDAAPRCRRDVAEIWPRPCSRPRSSQAARRRLSSCFRMVASRMRSTVWASATAEEPPSVCVTAEVTRWLAPRIGCPEAAFRRATPKSFTDTWLSPAESETSPTWAVYNEWRPLGSSAKVLRRGVDVESLEVRVSECLGSGP
jgi:hypothetical protein